MKCCNIKQLIGGLLIIAGVVLMVFAHRSNQSSGLEKIKKQVMRENGYSEGTSRYLVSGIAFVIVGAALVVFCRKK